MNYLMCRRIVALTFIALGMAGAQASPDSSPSDWAARAHLRVERSEVATARGFNAWMVVSRPIMPSGRLPAVLFIPWLSCDPVEVTGPTDDGYIRFARDLATATRFVIARAEKPGVDGSPGPACATSTLDDDLAAFSATLTALRARPDVDTNNVFLVGGSIGGAFAVALAAEQGTRIAGVASINSFARTWYEHMIDHERRRLVLTGMRGTQLGKAMRGFEIFYNEFLIGHETPGDVLRTHPELRGIWYDTTTGQYGRSAAYFHQVQALDLDSALAALAAPALFVGGEYDWVMGAQEPSFAMLTIGKLGTARVYSRMSHGLHVYASMDEAFHGKRGRYEPAVARDVAAWIHTHLRPSTSPAQ